MHRGIPVMRGGGGGSVLAALSHPAPLWGGRGGGVRCLSPATLNNPERWGSHSLPTSHTNRWSEALNKAGFSFFQPHHHHPQTGTAEGPPGSFLWGSKVALFYYWAISLGHGVIAARWNGISLTASWKDKRDGTGGGGRGAGGEGRGWWFCHKTSLKVLEKKKD